MKNFWCRLKELNPQPSHYKCAALPIELSRQICIIFMVKETNKVMSGIILLFNSFEKRLVA